MFYRVCVLCLLIAGFAAYPMGPSSSIDGLVTSDIAGTIPNARIGVDKVTGGFHRETTTNSSGYYLVDDLSPGAYSVWAEVRGLGCIIYPHLAVPPGERIHQNFHFVRAKRYPGNCEPVQKRSE